MQPIEEKSKRNIDELVGLNNEKVEVDKFKKYLEFLNKIKDSTDLDAPNLNMVFKRNPSNGKISFWRILADILYKLGWLC